MKHLSCANVPIALLMNGLHLSLTPPFSLVLNSLQHTRLPFVFLYLVYLISLLPTHSQKGNVKFITDVSWVLSFPHLPYHRNLYRRSYRNDQGRLYYHNVVSGQTTWVRPSDYPGSVVQEVDGKKIKGKLSPISFSNFIKRPIVVWPDTPSKRVHLDTEEWIGERAKHPFQSTH